MIGCGEVILNNRSVTVLVGLDLRIMLPWTKLRLVMGYCQFITEFIYNFLEVNKLTLIREVHLVESPKLGY